MNSMMLRLRIVMVCSLLPATALAQFQGQTQGVLTNAAVGVVVDGSPTSSQVLLRAAGSVDAAPTEWSASRFGDASPNHPNYSNLALLTGLNRLNDNTPSVPPTLASTVGFGGISTGGDVCPPIDVNGRLMISNSWYFLSVSVARKPVGHPYGKPNSLLRSLTNPQQALLSYYAEGSTGITPSLVNQTVVEQTGAQLGFDSSDVDVAGVDAGMGAITVDPDGVRSHLFAPVRDRFYFSLTQAWVAAHGWFLVEDPSVSAGLSPLDCKTIYCMTWESSLTWSKPTIAVHSADLFGENPDPETEIDALSVFHRDLGGSMVLRVVLSTTPASNSPNQLLGYDHLNMTVIPHPPVPAQPLTTISGVLVSDKLGLNSDGDPDNVDATCGHDPEAPGLDGVVGVPMSNFDPLDQKPLGLSIYRSISSNPDVGAVEDRVDLLVTGINLTSGGSGLVLFQFGLPTAQSIASLSGMPPVWYTLGTAIVDPGSTTASFALPGGLGNLGPVSFTASLYEGNSTDPVKGSWITLLDY